nr:23S rRNA (adenine(2503)-C(2))-methyltransferase RlmN [uncultured Stomatobaculum sp.]
MATELDLCSLTQSELGAYLKELGEPGFRAKQLFSWLHQKKAQRFDEMSNLPKSLRESLKEHARLPGLVQEVVQVSKNDGTEKYLFSLSDGNMIESVLMRYNYGNSVCISSQVGCRMGCRFCASTVDGLARNLTAGEMLAQVYAIERKIGERVSNVVVMGSGEPMDNYDNVVRFIRLLSEKDGLNISQRNITVSTCGLVPEIRRFADEKLQVTLALSLHAADDATRQRLMPIANRYALRDVLDACAYYFEKTGRRVSFEYSLVAGVNDTPAEAAKLIALLRHRKGHVNLIPVNPVVERSLKEPSLAAVHRFRDTLEKNGINVTIRKEMGRDIDGACGQLRRRYRDKREQGDTKEE